MISVLRRPFALLSVVVMVAALVFAAAAPAFAEDPDAPTEFSLAWPATQPTYGSVDPSDSYDIYTVFVPDGYRITATLTAQEAQGCEAILWSPPTTGITDSAWAVGDYSTNPQVISVDVPEGWGGNWFLGVAFTGDIGGEYVLDYTVEPIAPPPAMDDIPGNPIPASPVVGTTGNPDWLDVWAVDLAEGDTFSASLSADVNDSMLALLDPTSTSIANGTYNVVAYSDATGYPQEMSYAVPPGGAGTYYVIAYNNYSLEGTYTFDWSIGNTPPPPGGTDVTIDASVGQAPPALTFSIWGYVSPSGGNVGNNFVDFGYMTPEQPKEGAQLLEVSTNYPGYQVVASENHPLAGDAGTIADTTGDYGDISEWNFGQWDFPTTSGFGFMTYGPGSILEYAYRQFADSSLGETPQPVMMSGSTASDTMILSYKLNVDYMQPEGYYSNTITYMATGLF